MKYFFWLMIGYIVLIVSGCAQRAEISSTSPISNSTYYQSCVITQDALDEISDYQFFDLPPRSGCVLGSSGVLPRVDFSSHIFLTSSENNSDIDVFSLDFLITGELISDTTQLQLIDATSKTSFQIPLVGKNFTIDVKQLPLKKGVNIFLLNALRPFGTSQRIIKLWYMPYDTIETKELPLISGNNSQSCIIDPKSLDRQSCQFSNSKRVIYQHNYQSGTVFSEMSTSVRVESKTSDQQRKKLGPVLTPLLNEPSPLELVIQSSPYGMILNFYNSYVGEGREMFFDTTKKQWKDIHREVIEKNFGTGAYEYYSVSWSGSSLMISEFSYCCKSTKNKLQNYQYLFSLGGKLLSKKKITK